MRSILGGLRWLGLGIVPTLLAAQAANEGCNAVQSQSLQEEARQAFTQKRYQIAVQRLQDALASCPAQRSILLELSKAHLAQRAFPEALLRAQQFADSEPRSIDGRQNLANAYLLSGKLKEAEEQAHAILRVSPDNVPARKLQSNALYLLGSFQESRRILTKLLDQHPEDADAAYMLGRMYYQEGLVPEAAGLFERTLRIDSTAYRAWDNLGLCYQAMGNREKAVKSFLTSIKLTDKDHPDYDWAYANLADLFLKEGDAEQAFRAVSKAANRNPLSARNFYIGGKALEKLGKTDLAVNWLERSSTLDPTYADPLYALSHIFHRLGQEEKAAETRTRFEALKRQEPKARR